MSGDGIDDAPTRSYTLIVTADARRALAVIRKCLASDRFRVGTHFQDRMGEKSFFWADIELVIDQPTDVRSDGIDDYGRPKWAIVGDATTDEEIEIICAVEVDDSGTEFITIYWQET
jgi:hypothetical protein